MDQALDNRTVYDSAANLLRDVFGDIDKLTFPIDLGRVIDHCKLTIRQGKFKDKDIEGALDRKASTIFLSENDSFEEKNFTIAHEIGHLKLHEDVQTDIFTMHQLRHMLERKGEDAREDQADLFAAALLIPEKPLLKLWNVNQDIGVLSQIFGVPREAMELRLTEMRLLS